MTNQIGGVLALSVDASSGIVGASAGVGPVANDQFICYVRTGGTAVQVVAQASMTPVAEVSCASVDGMCPTVVGMALQHDESSLVTIFDDGRIVISRLALDSVKHRLLLKFDNCRPQAAIWHPTN